MLFSRHRTPPRQSTDDVVLAATRWLLQRSASAAADPHLTRLVERHLDWLTHRPALQAAALPLQQAWQDRPRSALKGGEPC